MEEEEDLGRIGISFCEGKKVEVVVTDVEILDGRVRRVPLRYQGRHTLMPSWEKQGGTADESSSASERRMGNFSTADMGMSPR